MRLLLDFSQDGQEFVLEKKSARKSGFIRSMLGEHTKDSGESSNHVAAAKASAMTAVGTSPHKASENDDPEGYVNPFASTDDDSSSAKQDSGLASGFVEAQSNRVYLPNIRGPVLEKVVEYLEWNAKYSDAPKDIDIPNFGSRISPDIALEL